MTMAVLAASVLSGCGFLEKEPNVICSETFYTSDSEALYGLAGVYGVLNSLQLYGRMYSLELSGIDDLCWFNRSTSNQYSNFYQYDTGNAEVYDAWNWLYKGIKNANEFMEAMKGSELEDSGAFYAEARFLRAYYHFLLAQAWGDVPLRDSAVKSYAKTNLGATSQYDVLKWAVSEMEACLDVLPEDAGNTPSRVNKAVAEGIIARVCLFTAGSSVEGDKSGLYETAKKYAGMVVSDPVYNLNPSYPQVFINMISDKYDTEYHESMWEADFIGDRSSADRYTNGTIGSMIGLQSTAIEDISELSCNYAYGMYNGSLKLWDLYWATDRTEDEERLATVTDARQEWNLPPYNYAGYTGTGAVYPYGGDATMGKPANSKDKTPYYAYKGGSLITTNEDPLIVPGNRNCGKWRRETIYEPVSSVAKAQFTQINFPILRYSDVLLMFAEADNELSTAPSDSAYNCVKAVRDRAGVKTLPKDDYDKESFRQLVRNERGRELCFEGLRKYDLIRWGIFVEAMHGYASQTADERWSKNGTANYAASIGAAVQPRHILLPIPAIELGVNKELVQNPLW